ncbi:beta-L-arabinofuranosidase domain-containing protein [Actinomadura opuntiae]|uniref:beta-L-arabinofuranosidase domain-containing protein n=1 Tax=Actinomadura sp. OS1-43 TaxID=604315 RepID=UPI00255AC91E|nr:beta-L-arabinofuranosidase domain-containing protein [Actinomadura sp. OS1-43]MDL4821812.1 glycoside hydrolase family 127 protein [Actinomadura sp. OS1-43]
MTSDSTQLRELGYTGQVRLRGPLAERVADAAATYGGLAIDDVLKGFRREAGLPAPGADMAGWASRTTEATFGQWASGLARLGAALDDDSLRQRAVDLVDGWAATLPDSGDARMRSYGLEKVFCGLVDTAVHTGYQDSLRVLERVADRAAETLDRSRRPATPTDRDGRQPAGLLEWYTLAENLYYGHLAGGDAALADFARIWHYDAYWDHFERTPAPGQAWDVPVWLHAYSHVNTFASAAAAHAVTGDDRYLRILRNAHDWVTITQSYATGGYGPGEWSLPDDGSLGRALEWRTDTAEITCGSWAAFKIATYLVTATGQARYLDWAERIVHSGIGATPPVRPDGRTPYYADYRLGTATKLPHWDAWPCCSGTYLQNVAHLADLVYFAADDGLAIGLFVPSQVAFAYGGRQVTVRQETTFPSADDVRLRVSAESPVEMTLRVRVPDWSTGLSLTIAGRDIPAPVHDGWAVIRRTWIPGDELTVTAGARLRALPVDRFHPHRVALAHGPVVLAQEADFSAPFAAGAPLEVIDIERLLVRRDDTLTFQPAYRGATEQPIGSFRPLALVPERRPYRVYHDLDAPRLI